MSEQGTHDDKCLHCVLWRTTLGFLGMEVPSQMGEHTVTMDPRQVINALGDMIGEMVGSQTDPKLRFDIVRALDKRICQRIVEVEQWRAPPQPGELTH